MDLVAPPAPRAPRPRAQSPEAKHWCFTYNNPTMYPDEMIEELEDLGVTYAVFQLEEGKNGTPHYQGYVAFKKKRSDSPSNTYFRGAGHWEISLGSPTQNRDYCTKDDGRIGDFSEIGTLPAGQGSRTDLVGLHSALKDGLTQADYANEYFSKFIQYPNLVQNYVVSTIEARDPSKPSHLGFSSAPRAPAKSRPRSGAWPKNWQRTSSDTLSESGSMDTEENELSYSTIFAIFTLFTQFKCLLTDTPSSGTQGDFFVKWQPQTSSSQQTTTRKRGGKKA